MRGNVFVGSGLTILGEQPRPEPLPVPAGSSRPDAEAHRRERLPWFHALIVRLKPLNVIVAMKLFFPPETIVFLSFTFDNHGNIA